jgi:hypothetical protein
MLRPTWCLSDEGVGLQREKGSCDGTLFRGMGYEIRRFVPL